MNGFEEGSVHQIEIQRYFGVRGGSVGRELDWHTRHSGFEYSVLTRASHSPDGGVRFLANLPFIKLTGDLIASAFIS